MTTPRDPDALLAAYLADGMEVLPDRVVDAVLDEAHRTRQRAVIGPWRTPSMFKSLLGAAAVIAVLVLGGAAWLGAFRPSVVTGPSTSPAASSTASPSPSASGLPAFPSRKETLVPGTYQVKTFSQPMTLTIPDAVDEIGPGEEVTGFIYDNGHTIQLGFEPIDASITIHDDFTINSNLCRPTTDVQEVPETPAAVGEWLHGNVAGSGPAMTVTDQPDVVVDGRVAKVYDVVTDGTCGTDDPPGDPDVWWGSNQTHRIYAIPTGTDTILVMTWNLAGALDLTQLNEIANRLVERMTFD